MYILHKERRNIDKILTKQRAFRPPIYTFLQFHPPRCKSVYDAGTQNRCPEDNFESDYLFFRPEQESFCAPMRTISYRHALKFFLTCRLRSAIV